MPIQEDNVIKKKTFYDINLNDKFFDSLKEDYNTFIDWFNRKLNEPVYVVYDKNNELQGFLYIKNEHGPVKDVTPPINAEHILKVGTFKIDAHNTKLGERFIKKIFDYALHWRVSHIYITIFKHHVGLIELLKIYGFKEYGVKNNNKDELVFLKDFISLTGNTNFDYPVINASSNKWILSVTPQYHSNLFPDSILKTEASAIINDISFTNSIHKVYIGRAYAMSEIKAGDTLVIYRPAEKGKSSWFCSVVTSLCVVEEIRPRTSFKSEKEFLDYAKPYSVFDEKDLLYWLHRPGPEMHAIKMTYNVALPKRLNMKTLVEMAGISRDIYWGLDQLTDDQFSAILKLSNVYDGLVIH